MQTQRDFWIVIRCDRHPRSKSHLVEGPSAYAVLRHETAGVVLIGDDADARICCEMQVPEHVALCHGSYEELFGVPTRWIPTKSRVGAPEDDGSTV